MGDRSVTVRDILATREIGAAMSGTFVIMLGFGMPAGWATDRRGRKAVLVPSFAALILALLLLGSATTPVVFMIAMAGFGLLTGVSGVPEMPMPSDLVSEDLYGSAVSVYRFVGDVGFLLGPLVAGFFAQNLGFRAAFAIAAAPVAVGLVLLLSIGETHRTARHPD